ncbi:hypothetical protein GV829_12140 [Sphingomonas lacunae]|uniref:Uncharacterized protein n=1 Tax=Sphingomonas lacunae TaxID=2698828 RepID=A0A6M4AVG4_9SPHN|nr:hypothetical protein [Sphingomonas lacunae]QJQ33095.1 hypothetical protein GV829_12140 [Sphingomonas lacunae]
MATALPAAPAFACSMDWSPIRQRVYEIRRDPELIRVRGTFVLEEVRGEPLRPGWLRDAHLIGHIVTRTGRIYPTVHPARNVLLEEEITCFIGTYMLPQADGPGIFYLRRDQQDGRHEILHMDAVRRADRFRTRG